MRVQIRTINPKYSVFYVTGAAIQEQILVEFPGINTPRI